MFRTAYGLPPGYRRGYQFADAFTDAARERMRRQADEAYAERNERLASAWRQGKPHRERDDAAPITDVARARALSDQVYEDKKQRLANAWRHR
jgi:hypothetical protein